MCLISIKFFNLNSYVDKSQIDRILLVNYSIVYGINIENIGNILNIRDIYDFRFTSRLSFNINLTRSKINSEYKSPMVIYNFKII